MEDPPAPPSEPNGVISPATPENAEAARSHRHEDDERDRDALELHEVETQEDEGSCGSLSSGEYRISSTRRTISRTSQQSQSSRTLPRKGFWGRVHTFWTRNVVLTVPQNKNRDHFALERTFLAYIRTSVILAMQGVLIAQLFRLQNHTGPRTDLGYYEVGIPLSVACHGAAVLVAGLGAHRFWKQQSAMALGTVYAGGWELNCIAMLITLIILATFILSVIIAAEINSHG